MQLKLTILFTAIALATSSLAAPTESEAVEAVEKRDCVVNASIIDQWNEGVWRRYRVAYSTTKPGVDMASGCGAWFDQGIRSKFLYNSFIDYLLTDRGLNRQLCWTMAQRPVLLQLGCRKLGYR
ncbi:hypothetical protein Moror_5005 [Moniliophthora roreri MCA 2997]|uniref:Uncharacterized protein n=1 Tax=Moniliophthora roreri (strain MCA 2997) TaxID=1381753 RepID=V2Y415_MONRO|nr:hypothetical protein Moror_5005 [Moniliophthora roreri MCA 2997]